MRVAPSPLAQLLCRTWLLRDFNRRNSFDGGDDVSETLLVERVLEQRDLCATTTPVDLDLVECESLRLRRSFESGPVPCDCSENKTCEECGYYSHGDEKLLGFLRHSASAPNSIENTQMRQGCSFTPFHLV